MSEIVLKYCSKCDQDKPLDNFHNSKLFKDGKDYTCKGCKKKYRQSEMGKLTLRKYYKSKTFKKNIKKWKQNNPEKVKAFQKKMRKERIENGKTSLYYKSNINHRLSVLLRSRLHAVLKGKNKSASTLTLLGCTPEQLKQHLEDQFTEGMSWDNYGQGKRKWEMDHIVPIKYFDLSDSFQQQLCFHHSNLQPLWWEDNKRKSGKITSQVKQLLNIKQ